MSEDAKICTGSTTRPKVETECSSPRKVSNADKQRQHLKQLSEQRRRKVSTLCGTPHPSCRAATQGPIAHALRALAHEVVYHSSRRYSWSHRHRCRSGSKRVGSG